MNRKIRSLIALVLCLIMVLGCLAGCGSEQAEEAPAEEVSEAIAPVTVVTKEATEETAPAEQTAPAAPVEAAEPTSRFAEALELMQYLGAMTADDAAKWAENITGAQASAAIAALGGSFSSSAETVTGEEFLAAVMSMLGYSETDVASAQKIFLTRGFLSFEGTDVLTVDGAANILMSALMANTASGAPFADNFGLIHWVNTDYADPFNRPGSSWYALVDGVSQPATEEYPALPKVILYDAQSWCDILVALGYEKDDPKNDEHIPKYFRNTCDGGVLTEQFWKHHCGDENDSHAECANDFTGEQNATLEIYELGENDFLNVCLHNFLGISDEKGLTMYGFERAEYGPYTDENVPAPGAYITHDYWNGYGMGNGYEVVEPVTVIEGTLSSGDVQTTTIDGVQYKNSQIYAYGKKLTTAPINIGKTLYFMLDHSGYVVGCSETPINQ